MAENYSRTIHVTTLRHLNFGPVLRIDSNTTSTISVPYIRLVRETCDFSGNSRKVDLYDLKPNCARPCQESIEMVWLWLFVT